MAPYLNNSEVKIKLKQSRCWNNFPFLRSVSMKGLMCIWILLFLFELQRINHVFDLLIRRIYMFWFIALIFFQLCLSSFKFDRLIFVEIVLIVSMKRIRDSSVSWQCKIKFIFFFAMSVKIFWEMSVSKDKSVQPWKSNCRALSFQPCPMRLV